MKHLYINFSHSAFGDAYELLSFVFVVRICLSYLLLVKLLHLISCDLWLNSLPTDCFVLHNTSQCLNVNISASIYPPLKLTPPLESSQNNLSNGGGGGVECRQNTTQTETIIYLLTAKPNILHFISRKSRISSKLFIASHRLYE